MVSLTIWAARKLKGQTHKKRHVKLVEVTYVTLDTVWVFDPESKHLEKRLQNEAQQSILKRSSRHLISGLRPSHECLVLLLKQTIISDENRGKSLCKLLKCLIVVLKHVSVMTFPSVFHMNF